MYRISDGYIIVEGKGGELPPVTPAGCTSYRAPLGGGGTKSLEKFSGRKEPTYHDIAGKKQKGGRGPRKVEDNHLGDRALGSIQFRQVLSLCLTASGLWCRLWRSALAPLDST